VVPEGGASDLVPLEVRERPDLVSTTFTGYWVYVAGPIAGAVLAVLIAFILRGPGGAKSGASGGNIMRGRCEY